MVAELVSSAQGKNEYLKAFRQAIARWQSGQHDHIYAETWPQFRSRCLAALDNIASKAQRGETHCVVTSGGVISAIVQDVLGLEDSRALQLTWNLANASVTIVQRTLEQNWTLVTYNELANFHGESSKRLSWL